MAIVHSSDQITLEIDHQLSLPVLPVQIRREILSGAAQLIAKERDVFLDLLMNEINKPVTAAHQEIDRAIETLEYLSTKISPQKPIGIVGAITPFNFPLNMTTHKIGAAIAAGCPIVHKPSSYTPNLTQRFYEILVQSGLPHEYYTLVLGHGKDIGYAMLDEKIAWVSFMGSTEVGQDLQEHRTGHMSLDLSNAAPVIIGPGADLDLATKKIITQGYTFSGQSCIAAQRVIVTENLYEEIQDQLIANVKHIAYGDTQDPKTVVGELISDQAADRVQSWIDEAVSMGAVLLVGSDRQGNLIAPTLLGDVNPRMKVAREEIFGPVVCLMRAKDMDEAVSVANGKAAGVQAWIYGDDADRVAKDLNYHGITANGKRIKSRSLNELDDLVLY